MLPSKLWLMWPVVRGLRWVEEAGDLHPARAGGTRVREHAVLVPVRESDGAVLVWVFDRKPEAAQALFIRLTEEEANKVFEADVYSVGLLEPVRRHLTNRWAVLAVKCDDDALHARPYRIPRRRSEDQFIAHLDRAADACPAFNVVTRKEQEMVPRVQLFAQEMARDLAFA